MSFMDHIANHRLYVGFASMLPTLNELAIRLK